MGVRGAPLVCFALTAVRCRGPEWWNCGLKGWIRGLRSEFARTLTQVGHPAYSGVVRVGDREPLDVGGDGHKGVVQGCQGESTCTAAITKRGFTILRFRLVLQSSDSDWFYNPQMSQEYTRSILKKPKTLKILKNLILKNLKP
eukprot:836253-Prorocentrum_minimum.AAC.1